ncbi:sigma-70 family RNA polymerase sigma factor [Chitinophaga sp.]|uniref:RNA polymerase sigma factor n=1 Tax=Chitinophaga sp. TaxID=1869181 RepID=UPI0031CFBCAF
MQKEKVSDRFEKVYDATYYKLYGFVKRYLDNDHEVKDVLQECYIRLWERMGTIRDDEKLLPMLRTWAMHATIDAVRKDARARLRNSAWQQNQEQTTVADEGLQWRETMSVYKAAIAALPPRQRLVFSLTKIEGLSQQETAARLKISVNTVKRHLGEAMRTLRASLPERALQGMLILSLLQTRMG